VKTNGKKSPVEGKKGRLKEGVDSDELSLE